MELGPFRVKKDGKSLRRNRYAWNKGKFLRTAAADLLPGHKLNHYDHWIG